MPALVFFLIPMKTWVEKMGAIYWVLPKVTMRCSHGPFLKAGH